MLQKHQIEDIRSVPAGKIAHIFPFDPATHTVAQDITRRIVAEIPRAEVFHIGSSKLGIAGENDIDMTVVAGNMFEKALKVFEEWYGVPAKTALHDNYAQWKWTQGGFPVEFHLIDIKKPYFQEQLKTQGILEGDNDLKMEYERMKLACNGLPYTKYLEQKYEFWNKVNQ
jgi:GrpB-like predicted nucleotidyltransferase (UPF0157 family)